MGRLRNDTIDGDSQADTIYGGDGDDTINGGSDPDTLDGGNGTDNVNGSWQNDTCDDAETRTSCETVTNHGSNGEPQPPAPPTPPPATAQPTTTVEDRTYDGDGHLVNIAITGPAGTTTTSVTWDLASPLPEILQLGNTGYIYGLTRELSIQNTTTTVQTSDAYGSNTTAGQTYDPWGQTSDDAPAVGFGYRGELTINGQVHLRNRDYQPATGAFTTTDPAPGQVGPAITNPYHYVANNPTNAIDPLGLFAFEEQSFRPALEYLVPLPGSNCGVICAPNELGIAGVYAGADITDLNSWEFAKYQVALCQVSLDLGRGVDGASQVKGVCHHWLDRYLELGADKCDFSFDFIPGGGGACFSFELAWKGVLDAKWDIILNAVTLGGYGCATDSYDVITNDNASGWQLGGAVLECVGFALQLSALRGGFEGIGTLRGAFKRPIPAEVGELSGGPTNPSLFGKLTYSSHGIRPYSAQAGMTAGQRGAIQAHHLIEQRFANVIGGNTDDWLAIVVTRAEHNAFTQAWRRLIPYGTGTRNATRASVEAAARVIYKDYPEILKALGLA